jgi:hypothetical protein
MKISAKRVTPDNILVGSVVVHNGDTVRRGWVGEVTCLDEDGIEVQYEDFLHQTYTYEWFFKNMLIVEKGVNKNCLGGHKVKKVDPSLLLSGKDKNREGRFIVWSKQARSNPKKVHKDYESAAAEAFRLETTTGKKFFPAEVLRCPEKENECALPAPPDSLCQGDDILRSVKVADFGKGVRVEIPKSMVVPMKEAGKKSGFKVVSAFTDGKGNFFRAKKLTVFK